MKPLILTGWMIPDFPDFTEVGFADIESLWRCSPTLIQPQHRP
jgi:hypothetical protein